jgi:hypothetical protein
MPISVTRPPKEWTIEDILTAIASSTWPTSQRRRPHTTGLVRQTVIVRAATRDHDEGLQFHILPSDDTLRALNILREAVGLQPLCDEHDDQGS